MPFVWVDVHYSHIKCITSNLQKTCSVNTGFEDECVSVKDGRLCLVIKQKKQEPRLGGHFVEVNP